MHLSITWEQPTVSKLPWDWESEDFQGNLKVAIQSVWLVRDEGADNRWPWWKELSNKYQPPPAASSDRVPLLISTQSPIVSWSEYVWSSPKSASDINKWSRPFRNIWSTDHVKAIMGYHWVEISFYAQYIHRNSRSSKQCLSSLQLFTGNAGWIGAGSMRGSEKIPSPPRSHRGTDVVLDGSLGPILHQEWATWGRSTRKKKIKIKTCATGC